MEKILQFYQKHRGRYYQKGLLLMYHRVVNLESDPPSLCVSPSNFTEQLEFLKKFCHPVSLQQLVKSLDKKGLPRRAIAVTFDDGYVDNLYNAKPLLESFDIPATVFLTTGYIGQNHEFWW